MSFSLIVEWAIRENGNYAFWVSFVLIDWNQGNGKISQDAEYHNTGPWPRSGSRANISLYPPWEAMPEGLWCNSIVLIFSLNHFICTITLMPPSINNSSPHSAHPTRTHGSRVGRQGAKKNVMAMCTMLHQYMAKYGCDTHLGKLRRVPVAVQRRGYGRNIKREKRGQWWCLELGREGERKPKKEGWRKGQEGK